MKRFIYKAKNKKGGLVRGEVEASTDEQAAKLVRKKELTVISITPVRTGPLGIFRNFKNRITSGQVASFTRQLATMFTAGLPITDSLLILRNQTGGAMQKVVAQILADIESGEALSATMSKHPGVFSPTYIALVKSGEMSGVLDKVLLRLADNLEKEQEFKAKVKAALIYPVIIIAGMIVVSLVMMIFVIPRLLVMYEEFDTALPLPTQILMAIMDFFTKTWPLLIVAGLVGAYFFAMYRQTKEGKRKTDEMIFAIPIIGNLSKTLILTELTRTLSLMVGAGVSILEGMNITSQVVGNRVIADALKDSADKVEKGFPVAYAFAKHPEAFPFILSQMVAVGEETGKMDEVLDKVSHVFEVESEQKVKALTSAVEPLIIIVLGMGVLFLVVAVILPIYNLTAQF